MSILVPVTSYEDFIRANQTLHEDGGPWTPQSVETPGARVEPVVGSPCGGPVCLCCFVTSDEAAANFHTNYLANISVDMAKYGNPTDLKFSWAFWPAYLEPGPISGSSLPIQSHIGDSGFLDTIGATDYTVFHAGGAWNSANKIAHNGTVTLAPGAGGNTTYLVLNISFALNHSNKSETIALYVQKIGFQILTPVLDSNGDATASSSPKISVGAIVGGVIGALVLIALIVLAIILCIRQRRKKAAKISEKASISAPSAPPPMATWQAPPNTSAQYDYRNGAAPHSPPSSAPWVIPPTPGSHGEQPLLAAAASMSRSPTYKSYSGASNRPISAGSSTSPHRVSPPIYGGSSYAYGSGGALGPLVTWANANRAFITEDLESKLAPAGYLPTDNPDDLTEEEWTNQFGLTKLEIIRLRKLYAGNHPSVEAAQVNKPRD